MVCIKHLNNNSCLSALTHRTLYLQEPETFRGDMERCIQRPPFIIVRTIDTPIRSSVCRHLISDCKSEPLCTPGLQSTVLNKLNETI